MKLIFSLILVLASQHASAATGKIRVVQVIKNQHLVVAQGKTDPVPTSGQTFLVNFPDDQQCSLVFKSAEGDKLTFDSSACDREDQLKKNLSIEPVLVAIAPVDTAPAPRATPQERRVGPIVNAQSFRFGLSVHGSLADSVEFDSRFRDDLVFNTDPAFGAGVKISFLEENSFGLIGSLEYESKRTVDSVSGNGITTFYTTKVEFTTFFLEVAAAYRWGAFYVPVGLNYSIPLVKNDEGDELEGTFGAVIGTGVFVHDNVSFELMYRVLGTKFKNDFNDNLYGTGFMGGLALNANYWF